ncbi:uncharacterized protein [Nicotiana tomentosiformis]|uniref:uncharacterized protein n=1 Tax=Nicotiana tomentosiformis TaxID=4098 RepID=UPI00051C5565
MALKYKREDPMTEISWWYNKEAYLMTYRAKLMPVRGEKFGKVLPEHAMEPPPLAKTVGRPKVKRNREKDEANRRQGEWAASRRGTIMTCIICSELDHNSRTCKVGAEGNVEDVSCSTPQPTQEGEHESEFVFMPTPRVPRHQTEPFGDGSEHESDPTLMTKIISEDQTRLLMRQNQLMSTGTRVISLRGDHTGVSYPTDLPYTPTKFTCKGKDAVTENQLEVARQKKVGKLILVVVGSCRSLTLLLDIFFQQPKLVSLSWLLKIEMLVFVN